MDQPETGTRHFRYCGPRCSAHGFPVTTLTTEPVDQVGLIGMIN
jgi:hypothetical protein